MKSLETELARMLRDRIVAHLDSALANGHDAATVATVAIHAAEVELMNLPALREAVCDGMKGLGFPSMNQH